MASIDDILNDLGSVESSQVEKTASQINSSMSDIERQAAELGLIDGTKSKEKTASINHNGGKMNLEDLYRDTFSEEAEKVASVQTNDDEMSKEAMGSLSGTAYNEIMDAKALELTIKVAMEMDSVPDSAATQDAQSGAGVIPGAVVANPQLPVAKNRGGNKDDEAMDTTPVYSTLEDVAVAKAKVVSSLEHPGTLSHQTVDVDSGLQEGGSQKTASVRSLTDLSKHELDLLQTEIPEDMMKEASDFVAEERLEMEELIKTANECMDFGAELAMEKIAAFEAAQKEKESKKEEEDEGEEEESAEEEKSEQEKKAYAMGGFISEGCINTLMEKGAEYYGDPNIYLEELVKEAGKLDAVRKALRGAADKAYKSGKGMANAAKNTNIAQKAKRQNPFSAAALANKAKKTGKTKSYGKALQYGKLKALKNKNIAKKVGVGAGLAGLTGMGYAAGNRNK